MKFKNILVPIDFSSCSINALQYAIDLARKIGAEIQIAHALSLPVVYNQVVITRLDENIKEEAFDKFNEIKENLFGLDKVPYSFLVNSGILTDVINEASTERKTDLIIMGTEGTSGLEELIFGTNAFDIIKSSSCPILIIPKNARLVNPINIGLAADYQIVPEKSVFEPLISFAKIYGSQIHILNVSKTNQISDLESNQAKKFEQYFKNIVHTYRFEIDDKVEAGIDRYLLSHDIDIMSIIKRDHNFMERIFKTNVLKNMVFHTDTPLLILPDKEVKA